jgi:ribosome-associated protein
MTNISDISEQFTVAEARELSPTDGVTKTATPIDTTDISYRLAMAIAAAAGERKGAEIVLIRVGEVSVLADYFVLVTGFSKVQVRAIANSIEGQVEETFERRPLRSEGMSDGSWVALDYGIVIVHIFMPQEREYYSLEAFWGHAEQIPYEEVER